MTEYENDFEDYAEMEFPDNLFDGSGADQKNADGGNRGKCSDTENEGKEEMKEPESVTPIKKLLYLIEKMDEKIDRIMKQVNKEGTQKAPDNKDEQFRFILQEVRNLKKKLDRTEDCLQATFGQITHAPNSEGEGRTRNFFRTMRKKGKKAQTNKKNEELLKLLSTDFDEQQLEQIELGLDEGLDMDVVRNYAKKDLSAKAMEKIRKIYQKMKMEASDDER